MRDTSGTLKYNFVVQKHAMPEPVHVCAKMDKTLRDLFWRLCEAEGIDLSQGIRELLQEAVDRGYVNRERRERVERLKRQYGVAREGGSA
jgi:hypothetical protein